MNFDKILLKILIILHILLMSDSEQENEEGFVPSIIQIN
jgi:hypothetical protein